uniref:Uncharacterized protein n=1 Tax=Chelonoidis abingdonii TaxID=106734 RepID=A0A8C0FZ79_CHEAB
MCEWGAVGLLCGRDDLTSVGRCHEVTGRCSGTAPHQASQEFGEPPLPWSRLAQGKKLTRLHLLGLSLEISTPLPSVRFHSEPAPMGSWEATGSCTPTFAFRPLNEVTLPLPRSWPSTKK